MAASNLSWMMTTFGGVLLVVGVRLLKRGQWPMRVGETPHCPKCDYILADDPNRCSECGTETRPETIVRGERRPRPAVALAGASLALLAVGFFIIAATGVVRDIDWNHYKPLGWLLNDLAAGDGQKDATAWVEIQRRLNLGHLSEADKYAVTETGLAVQNLTTGTAWNNAAILDFIAARFLDGKLTAAQADRLFAVMLNAKLDVRSVVGQGSPVPFIVTGTGRGPDTWWIRARLIEAQTDDGRIQKLGGASGGRFARFSNGSSLSPPHSPGTRHLRVRVELATDVERGLGTNFDERAPVSRLVTKDLTADFQVVEGQTPIATLSRPDAAVLKPLLEPQLTVSPDNGVYIEINTPGLPVDAAFDVFLRFGGKEHRLGSVSFRRSTASGYGTGEVTLGTDAPAATDVILRSSKEAARGTIDLNSIWEGEIVFHDVPLPRPIKHSSSMNK